MYRGESLARRGVVVVTFNYRLGALGYLAHPRLSVGAGPSANWGVLDQVVALRFVRDHIAGFGGDPANVTLFGESAGAMSAAALLAVPAARAACSGGPFSRAARSKCSASRKHPGPPSSSPAPSGSTSVDRGSLCAASVDEILAAQATLFGDLGVGASLPFRPVVDGALIPGHPDLAIARAGAVDALLVGTNRDEFRFFTIGQRALDDPGRRALPPTSIGGTSRPKGRRTRPRRSSRRYRALAKARGDESSDRRVFEAIAGDAVFWAPATRLAAASSRIRPTFVYRFDWASPFMGGSLGACHGLELPFVFGTTDHPFVGLFSGSGEDASSLSDAVQAAWVAFATDGRPGTVGGVGWPRYDEDRRATLVFDREITVAERPREQERLIWDRLLGQGPATPLIASA